MRRLLKHKKFIFWVIIFISAAIFFIVIKDTSFHVDETRHYDQILAFAQGNMKIDPFLTMIPSYHLLMAAATQIFNDNSVVFVRAASFAIGLASVVIFYLISKNNATWPAIRTLQYLFLPVLFPFLFLIYTDVTSLLMVLLSFYLSLRKNYSAGGIAGIASVLARQNNVIWLFFIFISIYVREYGFVWRKDALKSHIKKSWAFMLGFAVFMIFAVANNGFVLGDRAAHPFGILGLGNVYLMLFLFSFLFLPLNIANVLKISVYVRRNKKIILYLFSLFVFYFFTFANTHPYNQNPFFIRNKILMYFTSSEFLKVIFFIPIAFAILSLMVTKLKSKPHYLFYPFSILYLLPSWLVEPRYFIIPFVLFLSFREKRGIVVEFSLFAAFFTISLFLFYGTIKKIFFP